LSELGHSITVLTAGTHYLTGISTLKNRFRLWDEEERDGFSVIKTYAPAGHRKSIPRRALNYVVYSFLALIRGVGAPADFVFMGTDPLFVVPVGYILALLHRARLVLDERDLHPDTAVALGYLHPGLLVNCIEAWHNFVRRRADHIMAATPGIKRMLVDKGIDADKITILVNAFPPDAEEDNAPPPKAIRNGDFTVFYGGGMGPGVSELMTVLRAARILQDENVPISFLFAGEGDRKAEYAKYCEENRILNCRFLPIQPRSEMPALLKRVDICVHSLKADPFWRCALSSKVLDYLAYGKPVVFAGQGDIVDLLAASGGGISVPPEDPQKLARALLQLYESRETTVKMGMRGAHYVRETFSHEIQRAQLAQAFTI
jgi:glycosyltransferase involved in cell wall biosynthesis